MGKIQKSWIVFKISNISFWYHSQFQEIRYRFMNEHHMIWPDLSFDACFTFEFWFLNSVPRKFEWEISTPAIKNRHKIATQKFLKIATFLAQIATFVSNNVGKWPPFLFLLLFYVTIFWKMWHFIRKSSI